MLKRLYLVLNTVRYMRLAQLFCLVVRRIFKYQPRPSTRSKTSFNKISPITEFLTKQCKTHYQQFEFLNSSCKFNIDNVDWKFSDKPKLWRYNLHYFDYLCSDSLDDEHKAKLINSWIANNPVGSVDAWEPYTVSLRIVNWIKYLSRPNIKPDELWIQSLFKQTIWLEKNLECHILANHYLKNIVALYFASVFFNNDYAVRLNTKSKKIISSQLIEQFHDDGGHYEKSPMYHCICLEDLLDIINISKFDGSDDYLCNIFRPIAIKAIDFLEQIRLPDGNIPLFNDSAFSISTHPDRLISYAQGILGAKDIVSEKLCSTVSLDDSGYYIIRNDSSMCVIDCGSISPAYQPGHTHCDILSYELAIKGKRVVVDTGLHDYENSSERHYSRSTAAHNTLLIDGKEQSEIWGVFRVARRARVHQAHLLSEDGVRIFEGSYSPYWSGLSKIIHKRTIRSSAECWTFTDYVSGRGTHNICTYIHLHPDVSVQLLDSKYYFLRESEKLARFSFSDDVELVFEDTYYYPEFGVKLKNTTIKLSVNCKLPATLQYVIEEL